MLYDLAVAAGATLLGAVLVAILAVIIYPLYRLMLKRRVQRGALRSKHKSPAFDERESWPGTSNATLQKPENSSEDISDIEVEPSEKLSKLRLGSFVFSALKLYFIFFLIAQAARVVGYLYGSMAG